jgi:ATP diphosphatase
MEKNKMDKKPFFVFDLQNYDERQVSDLARFHKVDAEHALKQASAKFERRFRDMEVSAGDAFAGLSLDEKEALWQQAKSKEKT